MRVRKLYWLFFCGFLVMGCASFSEKIKVVAGTSIQQLQQLRKTALSKDFAYSYRECYDTSLVVLQKMGAYAFKKDYVKGVIACYVSPQDTTEIGIFLIETGTAVTQIEIGSRSSDTKQRFASEFFPALEKALSVEEKLEEVIQQQEDAWGNSR